jgi:uncharacterized protein YuzE
MKIDYDQEHDLLYVRFAGPSAAVERTDTLSPGVFADFDQDGRLVGLDVIEAKTVLGDDVRVEVALAPAG